MTSAISPKPFNFSELTERTEEPKQLMPTIMSYLPPEDQVSLQPFLGNSFDSDLGLFTRIQSIVDLAFHEIASLNRAEFPFPTVLKRFNEELDPSGKVLGDYLSVLIKLQRNPQKMIELLKKVSLAAREAIQSLDLGYSGITDEGVTSILELCPSLTSLNVCSTNVQGQFATQVTHNWKKLDISHCHEFDRDVVKKILSEASGLEELSISNITEEDLRLFDSSKLKKLELEGLNLSEQALEKLFRRCPQLEELTITKKSGRLEINISGEELLALNLSKLKSLKLNLCKSLNSEVIVQVFSQATNLEQLDVWGSNITGEELLALDLSKLKSLRINTKISKEMLAQILSRATNLECLDVSQTDITGEELLALDPSKLKIFDLSFCGNLNEKAMQTFLRKATELEDLNLSRVNVNGKELLDFDPSKLQFLNLNSCDNLDKESLKAFLTKATELKDLCIPDSYIDEELLPLIRRQCVVHGYYLKKTPYKENIQSI
ncbi:MAG: hypothetical protein PVI40_09290 [Chlamydiota bacterium]|jgi:hypothetical protein